MKNAIICLLMVAAGCAAPVRTDQRTGSSEAAVVSPAGVDTPQKIVPRPVRAADPPPIFRPTVNLTIYQLKVPSGAISRNETFWKRVDEQAVDVLAYDVLYKNGIRVGRGAMADLDYYWKVLGANVVKPEPTFVATAGAKLVELPMKRQVAGQIIYDFDARNTLTVRTFDRSDNILCVDFQPAPRKQGDVRVAICPMVRTLRKRIVVIGDAETGELEYVSPEKYFNLSLRADIPLDGFLVIAPSPEASPNMSLGHAFLVHDGNAEEMESVLLILPQAMQPDPAATGPSPAP